MKFLLIFILVFFNQVQSDSFLDGLLENMLGRIDINRIKALNINPICALQIEILINNKDILLKMYDASAKIPYSGMMDSGRMKLGNYDECIEIDHSINSIRILGKYCLAGLVIPDITNITNIDKYYKLATCIPDACSANELLTLANAFLFEGFPPIFIDDYCSTKETGKELSTGNIISMFAIFLITTIVIFSTIYDIYCQKINYKPAHPLSLAFSAVTNTKNILKVSQTPSGESIQIFNGFRAISVAWIISGHGIQIFANEVMPLENLDKLYTTMQSRASTYFFSGTLAVTTFFFMSGFLISYLYFKRKPKSWLAQLKTIPMLYIHRYIRLTSSLVMIYVIVLYIFEKLGSGPLWHSGCQSEINNCRKHGWSLFLYIQNYVNWDELCLIPLWYLSADMQLFLLAPLVLIPISLILTKPKGFKLAMMMLGMLNIIFVILNIGIRENFPETTKNDFDTHGRLTDFFIGMMMGIFMRFKKDQPFFGNMNNKSVINILIWIAVLISMFCLFLFYQDAVVKFNRTHRTLFYAFGRTIWAVGLSWMVYSCYHGYGGFINWFLCRPIFQVLGKLSYCMYLIHYLVLGHYSFSNRMQWYMSHYVEFNLFCGYYIETLLLSFIWSLFIESPILTIERYFFSRVKQEATEPKINVKNFKSTEA
ncbi:unnamed protein product [Psylliodes chrysocephalus]|uniref:Nose resistant-to-fluoxetine protein N-terminal domain-containing protein n=1 Tax=Psylliodes chrysocephalus TaxID=3402493 RepID=A0A9P0G8I0_9CUCU|nr:unnamed protein product [Psylliodes chrysocephala]